jgi:hypothetical protein
MVTSEMSAAQALADPAAQADLATRPMDDQIIAYL